MKPDLLKDTKEPYNAACIINEHLRKIRQYFVFILWDDSLTYIRL